MAWKKLTLIGLGLVISLGAIPIQAQPMRSHKRLALKHKHRLVSPAYKRGNTRKVKALRFKHIRPGKFRRASYIPVRPAQIDGKLCLASASALVLDQSTGECLVQKSPHVVQPIASITKLMTAMVVLDGKQSLDECITIEQEDVDTLRHSRSKLPVGMRLTRGEAMELALTASENRAAHALGRNYPGGLNSFVCAMNAKAQCLGLQSARFADPTGLSECNVASANDLARMVDAAHHYPQIRAFSTRPEVAINGFRRPLLFRNTNALVRNQEWNIGLSKTGFINEAGRCLVMQAMVANRPLLIVLLDSIGTRTRLGDANRIKQWLEARTHL